MWSFQKFTSPVSTARSSRRRMPKASASTIPQRNKSWRSATNQSLRHRIVGVWMLLSPVLERLGGVVALRVKVAVDLVLVFLENGGFFGRASTVHGFFPRRFEQFHDLGLLRIRQVGHNGAIGIIGHLD